MDGKRVIYQKAAPKVEVYEPKNPYAPRLVFDAGHTQTLLSYRFSLSSNNTTGSFSMTFYPDYLDAGGKAHSLFDDFQELQIVKIYEGNGLPGNKPVFTGVVRSKKYAMQAGDSGAMRRLSVSGTAITGLVSQFYIDLDVSACALTKQYRENEHLSKALTLENGKPNTSVKEIILSAWKCFYEISEQLGTPKIAEYINTFAGGVIGMFDVDNSRFHYPLGCLFQGQQTQDFFSLIDTLIPDPVYEKFPYTDPVTGNMRIKIRKSPFDAENWQKLSAAAPTIPAIVLKSFDITQSDEEVYTAFYAYLDGYSVAEEKALVISTMGNSSKTIDRTLQANEERFKTYGYRPLMAHFIGFGVRDGMDEGNTVENMEELSKNLCDWYKDLPDMLSGSITLAMTFNGEAGKEPIQVSGVVKFLGGEFYVDGICHSWNYGTGGEINISVSRGGIYEDGKFSGQIKHLTNMIRLLEDGKDPYPNNDIAATSLNR
ncbi:MAG: hypothetical protein ACTTKL_06475 [Treponema sp.]